MERDEQQGPREVEKYRSASYILRELIRDVSFQRFDRL